MCRYLTTFELILDRMNTLYNTRINLPLLGICGHGLPVTDAFLFQKVEKKFPAIMECYATPWPLWRESNNL